MEKGKEAQGTDTTIITNHRRARPWENGLNTFDMEYYNAWGDAAYGNYSRDGDDWWFGEWMNNNDMNVMMMIERGGETERQDNAEEADARLTKIVGERDPLKGTRRARPIELQNKYGVFQEDVDSEDVFADIDDDNEQTHDNNSITIMNRKHKLNKRQRQRRKEAHEAMQNTHNTIAMRTTNNNLVTRDTWYNVQRRPRPQLPQTHTQHSLGITKSKMTQIAKNGNDNFHNHDDNQRQQRHDITDMMRRCEMQQQLTKSMIVNGTS